MNLEYTIDLKMAKTGKIGFRLSNDLVKEFHSITTLRITCTSSIVVILAMYPSIPLLRHERDQLFFSDCNKQHPDRTDHFRYVIDRNLC